MSITKDFEKHVERWEEDVSPTAYYMPPPVNKLLTHARALEAMLKKVEWRTEQHRGLATCGECGMTRIEGHSADCKLAKLLEGVEDSHK